MPVKSASLIVPSIPPYEALETWFETFLGHNILPIVEACPLNRYWFSRYIDGRGRHIKFRFETDDLAAVQPRIDDLIKRFALTDDGYADYDYIGDIGRGEQSRFLGSNTRNPDAAHRAELAFDMLHAAARLTLDCLSHDEKTGHFELERKTDGFSLEVTMEQFHHLFCSVTGVAYLHRRTVASNDDADAAGGELGGGEDGHESESSPARRAPLELQETADHDLAAIPEARPPQHCRAAGWPEPSVLIWACEPLRDADCQVLRIWVREKHAMSTDFKMKRPEEILIPEKLPEYKAKMAYFHDKLSGLHHNIYFVEKILEFPLGLFTSPVDDMFLQLVIHNFLQAAILQITKLVTDSDGGAQTLRQFRNFMATAVQEAYQEEYRKLLKEVKFDAGTEQLIAAAKTVRDERIAHWDPQPKEVSLTFSKIRDIADKMTKLFEAAAFDVGYRYRIMAYDPTIPPPRGSDGRTDIERILDSVARDSPVLHLPEENPIAWPYTRQGWSAEAIEVFNRYRRRCGLPEA